MDNASSWLKETYTIIPAGGRVLDLACGSGRHSVFLEEHGFQVTAIDIDVTGIAEAGLQKTEIIQADLEGTSWPFEAAQFDGILVVNYLWRAHFPKLKEALKPGGVLIFDTFTVGNEQFGRPSNPKFLLKLGELKDVFSEFDLVAFREGYVEDPRPAMRQSIVVRRPQ